ncbi:MAG: type II restriction endonuclease [Bacteriophage sp.]|nr:MAG: type II restriction endonuclease [Bacteriophage sp.]
MLTSIETIDTISSLTEHERQLMNLEKYYTPEELERLLKKYRRKQNNARKRDIEFNLSWEEYLLFGKKLLGDGVCDYTLIPFDMHTDENGLGNPFYPSLERIDDEGPYAIDNCCVVGLRCNALKDCLVDKKTAILIKDKTDRKIVQQMMLHLSEERMEKLKGDYTFEDFILQYGTEEDKLALFDEEEEDMSPMQDFKNFMADRAANKHISDIVNETVTEEVEEQNSEEEKEPQEVEEGIAEEVPALPDDVEIAKAYTFYCQTFYDAGMKVDLSFSQFKSSYIRKCCALTGERLGAGLKPLLVTDWNKGFTKGNFMVVSPIMEKAMTDLMKTTRMTMTELAGIFKHVK